VQHPDILLDQEKGVVHGAVIVNADSPVLERLFTEPV